MDKYHWDKITNMHFDDGPPFELTDEEAKDYVCGRLAGADCTRVEGVLARSEWDRLLVEEIRRENGEQEEALAFEEALRQFARAVEGGVVAMLGLLISPATSPKLRRFARNSLARQSNAALTSALHSVAPAASCHQLPFRAVLAHASKADSEVETVLDGEIGDLDGRPCGRFAVESLGTEDRLRIEVDNLPLPQVRGLRVGIIVGETEVDSIDAYLVEKEVSGYEAIRSLGEKIRGQEVTLSFEWKVTETDD